MKGKKGGKEVTAEILIFLSFFLFFSFPPKTQNGEVEHFMVLESQKRQPRNTTTAAAAAAVNALAAAVAADAAAAGDAAPAVATADAAKIEEMKVKVRKFVKWGNV